MAHMLPTGSGRSARAASHLSCSSHRKLVIVNQLKPGTSASSESAKRTSRRSFISLLVGLGAGSASAAPVSSPSSQGEPAPAVAFPVSTPTPTPLPNDPTIFSYDFASDLPCNLRVREYWSIINQQRPKTWQQIAQQIQAGNYYALSIDLNVVPMADIRQAALYLPWALLQNYDYNAAVDAFKAYRNFDEHVKDLQRAASAAAVFAVTDGGQPAQQAQLAQQVQQAFILMSASLDGYLATVPARYTASLGLFQQAPAPAPAPPRPSPPPPPALAPAVESPNDTASPPEQS